MRAARARNVRNADVPAAACSCCAWRDVFSCEVGTSVAALPAVGSGFASSISTASPAPSAASQLL